VRHVGCSSYSRRLDSSGITVKVSAKGMKCLRREFEIVAWHVEMVVMWKLEAN
jgi:hypothetical protein